MQLGNWLALAREHGKTKPNGRHTDHNTFANASAGERCTEAELATWKGSNRSGVGKPTFSRVDSELPAGAARATVGSEDW
jgi:hypothetical protein